MQFYMLTHEIVSRYSGQPFYDFVASRIFAPVGMSASTYLFSAGETAGTAVHSFTRQGRRIPAWITEADEVIAGAGGVVSSTRDLSRWMMFLLGHGDENAKHAVPTAVVDETMSPQALVRGSSSLKTTATYGFGWDQRMYRGRRVRTCARKKMIAYVPHQAVWHNGGAPGVSTLVFMFSDDGLGIALLCNSNDQHDTNAEVLAAIASAVLGVTAETPQSVHRSVRTYAQFLASDIVPRSAALPFPLNPDLTQFEGPIEALAGTYSDAAYGTLTLCTPVSTSAHCRTVLEDFAATSPLEHNTLYAAWPRFWSSHLRVRLTTGLFDPTNLFPTGFGRNTSAFESPREPEASVEFDVGDDGRVRGMGVRWDDFPEHTEGSVEERAQVWFRRVDA
jgi:hypothetical protein